MTSNDDTDSKRVERNIKKVIVKVVDNGRKFTPRKDIPEPTAEDLNRRWRQGEVGGHVYMEEVTEESGKSET